MEESRGGMGGGVGGELGDLRYAGWLGRGMVSIGMPGSGDERVGCASERMTIICEFRKKLSACRWAKL